MNMYIVPLLKSFNSYHFAFSFFIRTSEKNTANYLSHSVVMDKVYIESMALSSLFQIQ